MSVFLEPDIHINNLVTFCYEQINEQRILFVYTIYMYVRIYVKTALKM